MGEFPLFSLARDDMRSSEHTASNYFGQNFYFLKKQWYGYKRRAEA